MENFSDKAYLITGPTSGFGRATAMQLASHGIVILVGRDRSRLMAVQQDIAAHGGSAVIVMCDFSDMDSVCAAAAEVISLRLPIVGMLNNAGVFPMRATFSKQGWDLTYATNHLGPFLLTEKLLPHLMDDTQILFVVSGVEDPERKPAKASGFRGGRYISAEASSRGFFQPGGSSMPGADAYATSKQCALATALEFARENPRLKINAIEPGFNPASGLGRGAHVALRILAKYVLGPLSPYIKYWSTSKQSARVMTKILVDKSVPTGRYYDERGKPMLSSLQVRDETFTARVVAETRELLALNRY